LHTAHDGVMQPIPDPEKRSIIFVYGASGSGKSTLLRDYCNEFKKLYPKSPIYLFSRLAADESLDDIKPERIIIDDTLADEKYTCDDFEKDSMILFDDIDSLDKKQWEAVNAIQNDILQTGRHRNLSCA
jgi:chromosomal replication initiation ATPase DnaA